MPGYNEAMVRQLEPIMQAIPGAKPGKMFGMPGYKVNGKLAVGAFGDGILVKVGEARAQAVIGQPGVQTCEMRGRVWKDWIKLTGDFEQHRTLLEEAVRFVAANG